ncbi:hypothetical protein C5S36_10420 [Candidatus Methanophagaceae archaeon]|nr:hypothetical protein C5S36_10420 [Methanophagales archaeon]
MKMTLILVSVGKKRLEMEGALSVKGAVD